MSADAEQNQRARTTADQALSGLAMVEAYLRENDEDALAILRTVDPLDLVAGLAHLASTLAVSLAQSRQVAPVEVTRLVRSHLLLAVAPPD